MRNGIANQDPRYVVEGDDHITDMNTGVKLHVYDSWFKITYDDDNVITKDDFTKEEQSLIWVIKQLITDPAVLKQREIDYKPLQVARRQKLSDLYENPTPMPNNAPIAEEGTTPYTG